MLKSSEKPRPVAEPVGPRGRFVGVVGVGKGLYQVWLHETVGDTTVKRTLLFEKDSRGGQSLAHTLFNVNTAVGKHLRDLGDLWKP